MEFIAIEEVRNGVGYGSVISGRLAGTLCSIEGAEIHTCYLAKVNRNASGFYSGHPVHVATDAKKYNPPKSEDRPGDFLNVAYMVGY